MAAASIPRKTYSEIYTATREAEQKLERAENGLDSELRRLHDQLAPPTVAYIKKDQSILRYHVWSTSLTSLVLVISYHLDHIMLPKQDDVMCGRRHGDVEI